MKLTLDFKARQCQLRTVCRRFSPKKRNKIRQKNQKGRSLKRTVLKPSANLWFLIISYNDILLFIQSALVCFFYFLFFTFFSRAQVKQTKIYRGKNFFQGFKSCTAVQKLSQHIFKYMFWPKGWKFHKISHPLCQIYHCLHFAWVSNKREGDKSWSHDYVHHVLRTRTCLKKLCRF